MCVFLSRGGCRFAFSQAPRNPLRESMTWLSAVNYGLVCFTAISFPNFSSPPHWGQKRFVWNSSRAPNALKVSEKFFSHMPCMRVSFSLMAWSRFNLLTWAPFLPRRARWKDTTRIYITGERKPVRASRVQKKAADGRLAASFSITLLIFCWQGV